MGGTTANMNPDAPSEFQEPLYTIPCESRGYDIALIPHSEQDRDRLNRKANQQDMTLAQFVRDEILTALTSGSDQVGVDTD